MIHLLNSLAQWAQERWDSPASLDQFTLDLDSLVNQDPDHVLTSMSLVVLLDQLLSNMAQPLARTCMALDHNMDQAHNNMVPILPEPSQEQ